MRTAVRRTLAGTTAVAGLLALAACGSDDAPDEVVNVRWQITAVGDAGTDVATQARTSFAAGADTFTATVGCEQVTGSVDWKGSGDDATVTFSDTDTRTEGDCGPGDGYLAGKLTDLLENRRTCAGVSTTATPCASSGCGSATPRRTASASPGDATLVPMTSPVSVPVPGPVTDADIADLASAGSLLLALDVDGTLVDHHGMMTERMHRTLQRAAEKHHVVIATGRSIGATLPIVRAAGVTRGFAVCSKDRKSVV